MNDTARLHPEVADFAADVRAQLSDLDADEIEELTGDLEADLQDRVDEVGMDDLGDPAAYATELRMAAGLPPRDVRGPSQPWYRTIATAVSGRVARLEERLRANAAASSALDFFIALRPVWWVARAWIAYEIAHLYLRPNSFGTTFPESPQGAFALFVAIVVSVQWGRRTWLPRVAWVRTVLIVGNILALLLAPFAIEHAREKHSYVNGIGDVRGLSAGRPPASGLRMNGDPIRNVFAYDAEGNPLTRVQLYDQRGKPLFVTKRRTWNWVSVPATLRTGQQAWNVFPLTRVKWRDSRFDRSISERVPEPGVVPQVWEPPMPHAPALMSTSTGGDSEGEPAKEAENSEKPKPTNNSSPDQN